MTLAVDVDEQVRAILGGVDGSVVAQLFRLFLRRHLSDVPLRQTKCELAQWGLIVAAPLTGCLIMCISRPPTDRRPLHDCGRADTK